MYQIKVSDVFDYVRCKFNDTEYLNYICKTFKIESGRLNFILNQTHLKGLDVNYKKLLYVLRENFNDFAFDWCKNEFEPIKTERLDSDRAKQKNNESLSLCRDTSVVENFINKYIFSLASEIDLYLIIKCVSTENLFAFREYSQNKKKTHRTSTYEINGVEIDIDELKGKKWIFNTPNHPFEIFLKNKYKFSFELY